MPIHFFYGNEDFLIEKEIDKLKQEILKGDINEFNYKRVDNPPFALFSELIRTNSMMFGNTVILIKCQKYFLESKDKETLDEKQASELIKGFSCVSDGVHIILYCPTPKGETKKPDSRKKLYKELIKIVKPVEFQQYKPYEENKIIPVIKKLAQDIDIEMDNSECLLLIQTIGSSFRDIYNQLNKLKLYAYPNKHISQELIKKTVANVSDVFDTIDKITNGKYVEALDMISSILQKEHYLAFLASLQTNFSNLTKLKICSGYMNKFELMEKFKYKNDFVLKLNMNKIKNISIEDMVRLKINLTKIEYKLKTGILQNPITAFEMAFCERNVV